MAYRIRYGQPGIGERTAISRNKKVLPVILAAVICIAVAICVLNPNLKQALIPGNPEVTEAAFATMIADMKEGVRFGDAMTAFCREIIDHAAIQG